MTIRNFVPQADGSGSIGTTAKQWYSASLKELYVAGNIKDGTYTATLADLVLGISASAESSSYATTASYAANASTPETVPTASYVAASGVQPGSFPVGDYTFPATSNVIVQGTLTATTVVAEYVTESHQYLTGSTKFGDAYNDVHEFTGSVDISGSFTYNGSSTFPSASYATTASYASVAQTLIGTIESASFATTASAATSITFIPVSASYSDNAMSASYTTMLEFDVNGDVMLRDL